MSVYINYRFTPLRLVLSKRDKITMDLFVKNASTETKNLTVRIILPKDLAFSKGGFKTAELFRVEKIKPNEERVFYLDIWPKHNTQAGEKEIRIIVQEHDTSYRYANKQYEKRISLIVEE